MSSISAVNYFLSSSGILNLRISVYQEKELKERLGKPPTGRK